MRRLLFGLLILGVLLAFPKSLAAACTVTWTGNAGDGQWTTAANWSSGSLPGANDNVCIPSGKTVTLVGSSSISSITSDGTFIISSPTCCSSILRVSSPMSPTKVRATSRLLASIPPPVP